MTIYPNIDINVSSSWIRHAAGVNSFLTRTQVILRISISTFIHIGTHTSSITAWRAITVNIDSARIRVSVHSYESASASWGGRVWTAVEGHPCMTVGIATRTGRASNDAVVGKWWAAVWQLAGSHIYPSTCKCKFQSDMFSLVYYSSNIV